MKTHIFIDVEAFGPPGIGRPFALGAAKFDMERGVSSAITKAADPLRVYSTETYGELVPHVAGHDAVRGALDLLASIHSAPSRWRENMGFSS